MKTFLCLCTLLILAGCATPKVTFDVAKKKDNGVRFQLAESLIKFDYAVEGTAAVKLTNSSKLVITAVPVPIESITYTIAGSGAIENWGVKTAIKASHRNDTLLLQELGSQVTDTRKQLVTDFGNAVATIIPFFAAGSDGGKTVDQGQSNPPGAITLAEILKSNACQVESDGRIKCENFVFETGGVNNGAKSEPYTADIVVSARPNNAIEVPKTFPFASDSIFYSACRTVTLNVKNANDPNLQGAASLRVAEAGWVELLALPEKGKVTFGASCGADVVAEDAALPTAMDFVNASLGAAKAIKEAKDKGKK